METKFEDEEDEFRSCCADEEELAIVESVKQSLKNDIIDDPSTKKA